MRSNSIEAQRFHSIAQPFLSKLGFGLLSDPSEIRSPFLGSLAEYKSNRGLYLRVAFESLDSRSSAITCGRAWLDEQGSTMLSNHYFMFAKRYRMEAPTHYSLGNDDETPKVMERILDDLKRTLPTVVSRVTLEDLLELESEMYGGEANGRRQLR